jgi:hypothetical protein
LAQYQAAASDSAKVIRAATRTSFFHKRGSSAGAQVTEEGTMWSVMTLLEW